MILLYGYLKLYNFKMGVLCLEFDLVTKYGSEFGKIFPFIIVCCFVSRRFFFNGPGTKFIMYNHTFGGATTICAIG